MSVYDKEMMAIVHDVTKWRPYLIGRQFQIKTDHKSIKYILEQRVSSMEQQRWVSKLMGYDYEIIYKKGVENVVADALSHLPGQAELSALSVPLFAGLDEIRKEVDGDKHMQELIHKLQSEPNVFRHYSWDGTDLRYKGRIVLVTSSTQKPSLLHEFHASPLAGHSSYLRTYKRLSRAFYWKGMRKEIKKICSRMRYMPKKQE